MSNSVYIVVGSGGQYDDAWTSNLIATFDETVAQKYIDDEPIRKNLWKKYGNKFNEMMNDWSELYEEKNPTPVWEGQYSLAIEQWDEARYELYEAYKVIAAESFGLDLTMEYYQEDDLEEKNVYLRIEEVRIL